MATSLSTFVCNSHNCRPAIATRRPSLKTPTGTKTIPNVSPFFGTPARPFSPRALIWRTSKQTGRNSDAAPLSALVNLQHKGIDGWQVSSHHSIIRETHVSFASSTRLRHFCGRPPAYSSRQSYCPIKPTLHLGLSMARISFSFGAPAEVLLNSSICHAEIQ
ncbi:hypothetical protein BDN71DRAFT_676120 [Pleurotus eryngii]|uniref:Uncharacterized protein n=1 Tax=Pleurotus eryngii TaxID=5323 RepID=A0A9P5ZYN2_PLEER|nr:hypothetical protein BDN71DRAFT_676120 [Pleurotus eryngii]